jgi:redox-sensitive bicupin YhaK (pirin superfamily)
MNIKIYHKTDQVKGQFSGGAILENKPIGFPQDRGHQAPYSNLFYWAHAWSDEGGLIGEHPHQGFEIMSLVLEGDIVHYDNKNKSWFPLQKGDIQIIRAGSGITHAEQVNPGSSFFQIWFDPDLTRTLSMEPSYNDYKKNELPIATKNGMSVTTIKGEGSPIKMETPGVSIFEINCIEGNHHFNLYDEKIASVYLISGYLKFGEHLLRKDDFAIISGITNLVFEAETPCRILLIQSPEKIDYTPYPELYKR